MLLAILGLAGGLSVGVGYVAFITVLGIIPRMMQLTKTFRKIREYEWAVILGVLAGTVGSLHPIRLVVSALWTLPVGLLSGMFIGMLAAALTEVLNVFPIIAKRLGVHKHILALIMAIVLGKIAGSLFQWLYFVYQ
ncbi:stage V sporulation protein AB [Bacillus sp. REN10]|uniref:stage V sporulation protein AB n=1 Tax=Bacillus sp. REN10 TaxID=2782541 RepID=UPI00193B405C|nr:stage V sporulation protein AB [Bacillus sp. REN10]